MKYHTMLAIFAARNNIYQWKLRSCSASINVGNFDHFVVEYNIGKSDISCCLYHSYICIRRQNCRYLPNMLT